MTRWLWKATFGYLLADTCCDGTGWTSHVHSNNTKDKSSNHGCFCQASSQEAAAANHSAACVFCQGSWAEVSNCCDKFGMVNQEISHREFDRTRKVHQRNWLSFCSNGDISRYHSYEEADTVFNQWAKEFPNLASKHSIGKSVQGRELLVLQITNGVAGERELRRPMFKWVKETLLENFIRMALSDGWPTCTEMKQ